jgi:hypothetical protein
MFLPHIAAYNRLTMKLSRHHRLLGALIALCSMLFMQLAVASYACPGMAAGVNPVALQQMRKAMPDCAGMDREQPSLCAAYAHPSKPTLDKADLPPVAPFIPSALMATVIALPADTHRALPAPHQMLLARSTAPPLAIQHCCLRI